jgi:hypothetical protein
VDGNVYSLDWLTSDDFLVRCVEESLARAADERRRTNCRLLLETLQGSPDRPGAIYDYWRSLEEFWLGIDVLPNEVPTLTLA